MAEKSSGRVVVVGQGYVGLPVAVRAVEAGFDVVGFDLDEPRVKALADGVSFAEDITDERLAAARARHLRPGACVILESTTYPGTIEEPR